MDNQEFQDRVRACERRLYATAYLLLHVTADCEDAVQEAVLRAWQRLPGLQNPQFFETWLTRIVINECKSQLRRRSRRGETELSPRLGRAGFPGAGAARGADRAKVEVPRGAHAEVHRRIHHRGDRAHTDAAPRHRGLPAGSGGSGC